MLPKQLTVFLASGVGCLGLVMMVLVALTPEESQPREVRGFIIWGEELFAYMPCLEDDPDFEPGWWGFGLIVDPVHQRQIWATHDSLSPKGRYERRMDGTYGPTGPIRSAVYFEGQGRLVERPGGWFGLGTEFPTSLELVQMPRMRAKTPSSCTSPYIDSWVS